MPDKYVGRPSILPACFFFGVGRLRRRTAHYIYPAFLLAVFSCFSPPSYGKEEGPNYSLVYTGETWANTKGGIDTGTEYVSVLDFTMDADLGSGTFFLWGFYSNSSDLSGRLVGDIQAVSNIDNSEVVRVLEAWYSHDFAGDTASIKAGLVDLNSEFDAIEPASLFVNGSHGIGADFSQTGENGPSLYPSTSPAVVVEFAPWVNWFLRFGAFDAIPNDPDNPDRMKLSLGDGALLVGEANYVTDLGLRLGTGVWGYTSKFDTSYAPMTAGSRESDNWGAYIFASSDLYSTENDNKLSGWIRYGFADNTSINFLKSYFGTGLVYTGLFPARPEDEIGFAIASAFIGDEAKNAARAAGEPVSNAETSIELTYRAQLTDWLAIQPDIQYVLNPGVTGGLSDALVVGVRFEMALNF